MFFRLSKVRKQSEEGARGRRMGMRLEWQVKMWTSDDLSVVFMPSKSRIKHFRGAGLQGGAGAKYEDGSP